MAEFLNNLSDNLAMSRPAKLLLLIITLCELSACSPKTEEQAQQPSDQTLMRYTQQHIGLSTYHRIRTGLNDSLANWVAHDLKAYLALRLYPYRLDTLLCFNQKKDKLVTALAFQCPTPDCKQDNVWYFYGVKINGQWYYFGGPTMVLPRQDLQHPTSFAALHQQAVRHIFGAYLQPGGAGGWQINEGFFSDLTSGAYGGRGPKTQAQWDSVYLMVVGNNWRYPDQERTIP